MKIVPLHLQEANALVAKWHGHHKPVHNHKFGIGCEHEGKLAAAAICARPASCALDDDATLEVARLVSDGTDLVCSKPYGAAARIAKEMGFEKKSDLHTEFLVGHQFESCRMGMGAR